MLQKAADHSAGGANDPAALLDAQLAPDMYPLTGQVQIASDTAKFATARLSGDVAPRFADNETTFVELQERLARTVTFIKGVRPSAIVEQERRTIILPRPTGDIRLTGEDYVQRIAVPAFFFHVSMVYAILRHRGVPLGRDDYLGSS
jgi:hypothetical protein